VEGRMGISFCLLSANLSGRIFRGNDVSPVKEPLLSLTAVGEGDTAETVLVNVSAKRSGSGTAATIGGIMSLSSKDPRQPCSLSGLKFRLVRPTVAMPTGQATAR
jgi:hypothetical protein